MKKKKQKKNLEAEEMKILKRKPKAMKNEIKIIEIKIII